MRSIAVTLYALFLVAGALQGAGGAAAQDRLVLGPRQFERDTSGAGAVLCAWSIYLSIQAQTAACGLPRRPIDDAIDEAVTAIDEFILTNSSLRPSRAMLEEFKRRAAPVDVEAARRSGRNICQGGDLAHFRSIEPDKLRASMKALLAVPREPVMNPCL